MKNYKMLKVEDVMQNFQTYALIVSDDEAFSGKLRQEIRTNEISKDWRSLVLSNNVNNKHKDLPINKIFEIILKIKKVHIVIFFDFEKKREFCLDLLKILNKYKGAQKIVQFCFFSESHTKKNLEEALNAGAHIVDYKRPDMSDIVQNIQFIKNKEFNHLPQYATSKGYNTVYWPKFFGKIDLISESEVNIETTFNKINPNEDWLNRFLPNLAGGKVFLTNSTHLEKKCRWIEDINSLRFEYSLARLINSDYLNVNNVENKEEKLDKYIYQTSKRISPDKYSEAMTEAKNNFNSIIDPRIRVIVFDKKVSLLQSNHEDEILKFNLFSYPYLSYNKEDYKNAAAHIIAIQWDDFAVLDHNENLLKLSDEEKLNALEDCIGEFINEDTILIIFGLENKKLRKIIKKQLNVSFEVNSEFLDEIVEVYEQKVNHTPDEIANTIYPKELIEYQLDTCIKLELPIIIEELNEHRVSFSSPMEISNNTIIKLEHPCTCYVLVQDKLCSDGLYGGILMGLNEQEKKLIRQEVNTLMHIPSRKDEESEVIDFMNLNSAEFIKRQKEKLKKERDVITQLKAIS
jgi:hypothetical protein